MDAELVEGLDLVLGLHPSAITSAPVPDAS
jgi:hypothetical protein